MKETTATSIDLLVHPGYTLSRIASKFMITGDSEEYILLLKNAWCAAIDEVAKDQDRYLVLVNGVHVPDELLEGEGRNPYRTLYRDIVHHAQSTSPRLFLVTPTLYPDSFSVTRIAKDRYRAEHHGQSFLYNSLQLVIRAYGEHVDEHQHAGCVDANARALAQNLHIPTANSVIDPALSLPSQPLIKIPIGFDVPTTLYLTVEQLRRMSVSPSLRAE